MTKEDKKELSKEQTEAISKEIVKSVVHIARTHTVNQSDVWNVMLAVSKLKVIV